MIDYFSLALSHGLLLLCLFRIARNKALDPLVARPQRRHNAAKNDTPASDDLSLDAQSGADDAA
ncbi:MAG: hypothetical protein ABJ242_02880 [Marinomonas sp.]